MRFKSLLLLTVLATGASAQAAQRGNNARRNAQPGPQRGQMMVRQAIERLVRDSVQPTQAQMQQIRAVDRRFEADRVRLNNAEMEARETLRGLMVDPNADPAKLAATLDQLVKFPGQRAQLMEAEQKELAAVLTPLQRAKYWAIQEQVRRQAQMERGRGGRPPEGRGSPPPPATKRP